MLAALQSLSSWPRMGLDTVTGREAATNLKTTTTGFPENNYSRITKSIPCSPHFSLFWLLMWQPIEGEGRQFPNVFKSIGDVSWVNEVGALDELIL